MGTRLHTTDDNPGADANGAALRIRAVVSRLRWRVRLQAALRLGLWFGAAGLFVFAAAIALTRLRVLDPSAPLWGGLTALSLTALGLGLGLARRLDDIRLAASLDAAGELHSRLGSALAFAALERPTAMQRLAIEDAVSVLDRAEPRRAAPWAIAPFLAGLVAVTLALAVTAPALWLLDPKVAPGEAGTLSRLTVPSPMQRAKVELATEDLEKLAALAEETAPDEPERTDPKASDFLADLNELIRALQEGKLTPEDAQARLAALEKALEAWKEQAQAQEAIDKKIEAAAKAQKKPDPALAEALEAMKQRALEEAARELEALRKKLEDGRLDDKAKEKIAKDLAALAKDLKSERQKEKERLEKERDRLKEKEKKEKDRFAGRDKDRLKEVERQLQRLDQDMQSAANDNPERQLERLSDDLDEAAAELMRRLSEKMGPMDTAQAESPEDMARRERQRDGQQGGESGEEGSEAKQGGDKKGQGAGEELTDDELERAAKALKRMAKRGAAGQKMRAAGGKMVDLKEMLRRAAKQGEGQGDGEDTADGDAKRAFERGAKGQGDKPGDGEGMRLSDKGGKPGDMMLLGGRGQGQGQKIPGQGQGGQSDEGLGEGIGKGHDAQLTGGKTALDVKTVEDFVAGKQDDGPSQSRVIMAAAGRGFASRAYAEVHQDYSGVVEDTLDKERVPPGKRTYVRRYFDLIRPR